MTESPRPKNNPQNWTTRTNPPLSPVILIFITALDTTWRAFVPTLGGVFLGIGLDHLLGIAPVGTIVCLIGGTALSILLIVKQLRDVRKPLN